MIEPLILAIDTSCDETSAAVTCGRRVLSNVISSQVSLHKKYGGVFPALAKRAHQERIDLVVIEAIKRAYIALHQDCSLPNSKNSKSEARNPKQNMRNFKSQNTKYLENLNFGRLNLANRQASLFRTFEFRISDLPLQAVAVTQGPGLAIALEVGIKKAKDLVRCIDAKMQRSKENSDISETMHLCVSESPKLIAVDHMEGHIYSTLAQNKNGLPKREILFPALCLLVSGGHTALVLMKDHGVYQILGSTLDDACGEALDKAAKILKLGYPGGPVIERLAEQAGSKKSKYSLSPPLKDKSNLNFSYSGLKTQFLYLVESLSEKKFGQNLKNLAAAFQEASFEQLIRKTSKAIEIYQPKTLLCGGGVIANKYLRKLLRSLAKKNNIPVFFPPKKNLITDNAAMIGIAAYHKFLRKEFITDLKTLDREPRLSL